MAVVQKWDAGSSITMPVVGGHAVTSAIAAAGKGFGDIGDRLREAEEAKSLANYRAEQLQMDERKQDFAEGAGQRAIMEEDRKRRVANERALLADTVANEAGGSLAPEFFANPEIQKLLEGRDFNQEQFVKDNRKLFSDPKRYRSTIRKGLLNSGFTGEEADTIATKRVAEMFPTMDADIAKSLLAKPGSQSAVNIFGGGASRSGGSGSYKLFSDQANQVQEADLINNFVEQNRVSSGKPFMLFGKRIMDPGDYDLVASDINDFVAQAKKGGISTGTALTILQQDMDTGNDLSYNPGKLSQKQLDAMKVRAAGIDATNREMYNTKTGMAGGPAEQAAAQAFAQQQAYNSDIISRLSPQANTFADRAAALRKALGITGTGAGQGGGPGGSILTPQPQPQPQPQPEPQIVPQPAPETPAPQGGIMPNMINVPADIPANRQARTALFAATDQVKNSVVNKIDRGHKPDLAEATFLRSSPAWDSLADVYKQRILAIIAKNKNS